MIFVFGNFLVFLGIDFDKIIVKSNGLLQKLRMTFKKLQLIEKSQKSWSCKEGSVTSQ